MPRRSGAPRRATQAIKARRRKRPRAARPDAAALSVLADGRRVSVINALAGAGKTRVLAEVARAWAGAGLGPVVGITASQSARNTLTVGVTESYNSARFLGHLAGKRGVRGPVETGPGTLMLVDEASMMSGPDLADLAEARGGKVVLAGDTRQLQAVQNGGGMALLADRLGYVRQDSACSGSRAAVRVPVPQLALVEEGFKRLQPVGSLEVKLLLRDGQQPEEVNVPAAYVAPLKFRSPGVGSADQEVIAP